MTTTRAQRITCMSVILSQASMFPVSGRFAPRAVDRTGLVPREDGGRDYNQTVSVSEHRKDAPESVRCFVLTISDTRSEATDKSGDVIVGLLATAGHVIVGRSILKDDPAAVRHALDAHRHGAEVAITTGGTGITSRDSTYEAIAGLLEKRLDGFGELFRMLSYHEIGPAAMMTRACAGTFGGMAVFALPGSENAVRLAMTRLIIPEIGHIVRELRR